MNTDKLKSLQIASDQKRRPRRPIWAIFAAVLLLTAAASWFAWPRAADKERVAVTAVKPPPGVAAARQGSQATPAADPASGPSSNVVLTVSGYIINRQRIEISPRFLGLVKWIGVKKGDAVTNGQVVVLLDDAEYKPRVSEAEGRLAGARAGVTRAELEYERVVALAKTDIQSKKDQDDARWQLEAARAELKQAEANLELARTYLDWTVIRSPVNGVVLEKLVNPDELVVPQSFGGARGPSTALLAVADPKDLQVEIDLSEADVSKIALGQKCRVSPEAYPDRNYEGAVAEIAPEANRSKGTLQIKVQVLNPDRYLTPELSARVDFLKP